MDNADLKHRFQFHPADADNTKDAHEDIRASCLHLAGVINQLCPEGREKSLAVTNLEQAMMWANAAIARGDGPKE
jgi:hypothetical protein